MCVLTSFSLNLLLCIIWVEYCLDLDTLQYLEDMSVMFN